MPTALLCAGGTGGHLFPAEALATELNARGWTCHLATDERGLRFADTFPGKVSEITFRPPSLRSPVAMLKAVPKGISTYLKARRLISSVGPDVAIGFGGYPSLMPMLAASHRGKPTVLHEQNAVLGRANRALSRGADAIAGGFPIKGQKAIVTGNPLRPAAHDAAKIAYRESLDSDPFHLLVFGGSQGASYFSEVVPAALALLTDAGRKRIRLTLQAPRNGAGEAQNALNEMGIVADVAPFFADLPALIAASQVVIGRAGASTVGELALIGRPALLVPYPHALDHDQAANAAELAATGGAEVVRERDLTAPVLADRLRHWLDNPADLAHKAQAAKTAGKPDAAARLADLVEDAARRRAI